MVILRNRNKITDFWMFLAWASPFNMLMPIISHILCISTLHSRVSHVLTLWGLEHDMSHVLTLCGLDYHIFSMLTF